MKGVGALPFFDGATVVLTGGTAGLGVGLLDLLSRHCRRIYLGIPIVSRAIVHSCHAVDTCPCTPILLPTPPHTLLPLLHPLSVPVAHQGRGSTRTLCRKRRGSSYRDRRGRPDAHEP